MTSDRFLPDPFAGSDATLVDCLRAAAGNSSTGVRLYDRRGKSTVRRTWAEVIDGARRWATWARSTGVAPGDHVLISLPTSWEFLHAWLGSVLVGARPLALALPRAMGGEEAFRRRIDGLWTFLDPAWLVSEDWGRRLAEEGGLPERAAGRVHLTPDLESHRPLAEPDFDRPAADGLAFVQLTSGSTSFPKAVQIGHAGILANCRGIGLTGGGVVEDDVVVCWLPLNHDMGLVGLFLFALYWGRELVLMRPETFLARPIRWLESFGAFGGTITAAPDFAYRYAIDKVEPDDRRGLDLSTWRVACTGAETVWESTLDRFAEAYGEAGFSREAFIPCYGMAETTLAATFQLAGQGPRVAEFGPEAFGCAPGERPRRLVSVGIPLLGHEIEIRDESGRPVGDGVEGEIAVRGPCIFAGYHGQPEETAAAIVDGWFLTGDLGLTDGGELFITGRKKDILIVDGRSIGAAELEWIATEAVRYAEGRAGVFARTVDGREEAILVVEVPSDDDRRMADWSEAIHRGIARDFGAPLADLVFVRRGSIPKTTSGKVRRNEVRRLYDNDELERVGPPTRQGV